MEQHNWSEFKKRIPIKASPAIVFEYWMSQDKLEQWFLRSAQFYKLDKDPKDSSMRIEKGDSYSWMWHGSDNVAEGEVIETNNSNYLKFTFLGCIVAVEIKEEQGETLIELVQNEIPLDDASRVSYYVGCTRGWTFYLTNLKSILEGGIDLRNRNTSLENVINT